MIKRCANGWLPLPAYPVEIADRRRLGHRLRELRYNPQRCLPPQEAAGLSTLLHDKQEWIARQPTDSVGRRERFARLRAINEELHWPLAQEDERIRLDMARVDRELSANAVLRRRDYAFCLYPEETLRPFCAGLM